MKKYLSLFLSFICMLTFFAGCTDKTEDSSSQALIKEEIQPLVESGSSAYSVVLPADYSECLDYAATELTDFINQSTGASLKIITDDKAVYDENNCYISLGKTELLETANFQFDYSTLNLDGFFTKTVGNMVFIDGYRDKGVLYGVYDFLEKNLGVRFLTADCTHVPQLSSVKLYATDEVEIPDFTGRLYLSSGTYKNYASPEFIGRSRQDSSYIDYQDPKYGEGTSFYMRTGRDHNMYAFVDYEKYGEEHPEFFVENDGEYADYGDTWRMLCLTNGITDDGKLDETMDISVAKIVVEEMKKDILANPDAFYFAFEQSDGSSIYCKCDRCKAGWDKYKASGVLVRFVNVVARQIQKEFEAEGIQRDFRIVTFAYAYTKEAPVKAENGTWVPIDESVKTDEKVVIRLAGVKNALDPWLEEGTNWFSVIEKWKKCAGEFMGWVHDKDYADYISYYPSLGTIKASVENIKSVGFSSVLVQAAHNEPNDWQSDLRGYIYRNLLWDSEKDVETLFNEFVDNYWGGTAAPYVKKLINAYEQNYAIALKNNPNLEIQTSKTEYLDPTSGCLDLAFLNNMMSLMTEAREAVEGNDLYTSAEKNTYKQRIAMVQTTPMYTTVRFYAKYFPLSSSQQAKNYYTEFFKLAEEAEISMCYEIMSVAQYKERLGVI